MYQARFGGGLIEVEGRPPPRGRPSTNQTHDGRTTMNRGLIGTIIGILVIIILVIVILQLT